MNERTAELKDRLRHALDVRNKKAVDLSTDLGITKSAISQYLSGRSKSMDSERLYAICEYLNVSEPWLLGYDVPMEKMSDKKNDLIAEATLRMKSDLDFYNVVSMSMQLPKDKLVAVRNLLITFTKDSQDQV